MVLQDGEALLRELRPEPALARVWTVTRCVPLALGLPIAFIWFAASTGSDSLLVTWLAAAIMMGILILVFGYSYFSLLRRTYLYSMTDQRCVFEGGILLRIERSVPYHKITDVQVSQNLLEQFLGISTLSIFTPGTGTMQAEIAFVGLADAHEPAAIVNGQLTKHKATGQQND